MMRTYLITCGVASVLAFVFFAVDKANAADGRARIPEICLLTLAALGGGVGAILGRGLLHHKSNARRKPHFAVVITLSFLAQVAFLGHLLYTGG